MNSLFMNIIQMNIIFIIA